MSPLLERTSFAQGWVPDADALQAPANGLLRADNCVLDELGIIGLRQGSLTLNAYGGDVHSLYTAVLNATRYRFVGVVDNVFVNTGFLSAMSGAGDVSFGSHRGQVLFARGSTTKKYDGATLRKWGIGMTGAVVSVTPAAPDTKTFATCDTAEAPAFVFTEDDGTGPTFTTGQDGTANGAIILNPNDTTQRGTMTKTFATAQDFSVYDGGTAGGDDDVLELYVYSPEPKDLLAVDIAVDVNASSTNAFQDDYYFGSFQSGVTAALAPVAPAGSRSRNGAPVVGAAVSRIRTDKPVLNAGWSKLQIRRGDMLRVGTTALKGWNTVKAVRITITTLGSVGVTFDRIRIVSQRMLGPYQWAYVYAFNSGSYVGLSAPSAFSTAVAVNTQSTGITIAADAARDTQVNEVWLYRSGGALDQFYRVAVKTGVVPGAIAITDTLSDADALIANLPLQTDNAPPPANIIGIAGPYYDRLFALTASALYPSRQLNPDSFASGQVVAVGGADEVAYWVKRSLGGLYVGTSKDIYRLEGTGAELPDGTVDFTFMPLNIDHPPIGDAVAQDGNRLIYLAADGWRTVAGAGSQLLVGATSLLYKGYTRHGVGPVQLTGGRFRPTIAKGQLLVVTPEAGATTSSPVLYRHAPLVTSWYRHVYPTALRCLYTEPDGTVLAGDSAGVVRQLDIGTADDGVGIPVTIWTKVDANDQHFNRKDVIDVRVQLDTGAATASVAVHFDGSATAVATVLAAQTPLGVTAAPLNNLPAFSQVQLRLTGSFTAFRFAAFGVQHTALPVPFVGKLTPSDRGDPHLKTLSGFQLRLCTLGVPRVLTPILDGVAQTPLTVTSGIDDPIDVTYTFPAPVTAVDVTVSVDGDVELYAYAPIVTFRRPLGVRSYDTGPIVVSDLDLLWLRAIRVKVNAGADLTITAYMDSQALATVVGVVTPGIDTVVVVPVGRACVGRVVRLVMTSTAPFFPYYLEIVRRQSGLGTEKGHQRYPLALETGGVA